MHDVVVVGFVNGALVYTEDVNLRLNDTPSLQVATYWQIQHI